MKTPQECKTLQFEGIAYAYMGAQKPALDSLSMRLEGGKRVSLIGKNGSGKSTLMLIANGTLKPAEGCLQLNSQLVSYDRKGLRRLRESVGIVFQNPDDQLFSASVRQDISLGPLNLGLSQEEARERVNEVVELCNLAPLLSRPTHALSGGEKTRVALAGVLAMRPAFLFADEVTNSLDPWMRSQVLMILSEWVRLGNTVILSTHDWTLAEKWSDQIYWLDSGHIYRQGTPNEVLKGADIPSSFGA